MMAIELYVKQYFVIEKQTKEIHDTPVNGTSETQLIETKEYGPYDSKNSAKGRVASLKKKRITEGWTQYPKNKDELYNGALDISYLIKEGFKPF